LPPVGVGNGPEPALLTHREPDYDQDLRDDPDLDDEYDDEEEQPLTDAQRKKLRKKKIWRRIRRTMYVFTALMIIVPTVGFFIAYQVVEVPNAEQVAAGQLQTAQVNFADGQLMTTVVPQGAENRKMVRYEDIPETVKHAVYAAEDAEFETNPGFDITGVLTAAWNQATGGDGGGSTITQQYIKVATQEDDPTLTRKALEVVKAYKMNNTYSKEDILEAYLNTIYFGRSAYGIAAASKAYYNKELKDLTASEAALLAGMIQNPGRFKDMEYMQRRWKFVMGQLVDKGWLQAEVRDAATFPTLIDVALSRPKAATGPWAHIQEAAFEEVAKYGFSLEDIHRDGLIIQTTINRPLQEQAEAAVNEVMKDQPPTLRPAMVVTDPKSGDVVAYYGGANGIGTDWAAARQEPGSSFKPFDLVALLQDGKGLAEQYDGTSGRKFAGREAPVRNSGNASCGEQCTVAEAMRRSINTVFYDIAVNTVGTGAVADAAAAAGITSPLRPEGGGNPDGNIAIGGGHTQVTTAEMSSAYATFAANGVYRAPRLVSKILYPNGNVAWTAPETPDKLAFDPEDSRNNAKIARNVTEALEPVLEYADLECAGGRECAGKTGSHQWSGEGGSPDDNVKAWMVGYTPQLSTAVSLAAEDPNGKRLPLRDKNDDVIYGGDLPGQIWKTFMDNSLKDAEKERFGKFEPIGERVSENTGTNTSSQSSTNSQTTTTDPTTTTTTTETETTTETTTEDEEPQPGCPPFCGGQGPPPGGG
jgi:membrane peptidoglycan carboxypeptidase